MTSAGNEGNSAWQYITAPADADSVITVGATRPGGIRATFSSTGPTADGRIKPDVVGPGNPVRSCEASLKPSVMSCKLMMDSGTSMATPAVAGTAILVRQFFTDGLHATSAPAGFSHSAYNASSPSAALIKAVLVSSTTPVEFGYTFEQGLDLTIDAVRKVI